MTTADNDVVAHCALCARVPDHAGPPPLGWTADRHDSGSTDRTRWVCEDCTRRFVRSIEAKLDHQWW